MQCDSGGKTCAPIGTNGKGETYVLVAADVGHTIAVQETASNLKGASAPASSQPTSQVLPLAPVSTAAPTITGTPQQGQTLTEHHGTWTNEPTGYTYQWLQCEALGNGCLPITGATSQTYVPVTGDVGRTIAVQETASNAGGAGAAATSTATAKVLSAPPANTAAPTITGTAQQGQTLTEHHGTWTNEPTGYGYQWLQCDSSGKNCVTISGAMSQTYVPGTGDVGHTIVVQETASNGGGSSGPASSSATPAVLPPPPSNTAA